MKRYIWAPLAFLCVGIAFYIYYGLTMNAWTENLPNILGYAVILIALSWALKKKDELADDRNGNYDKSYRNAPQPESSRNDEKPTSCVNAPKPESSKKDVKTINGAHDREIMRIVESVENHKKNQ